jgi:hypothetical protein
MKSFVVSVFGILSLALHVGCCGVSSCDSGNPYGRSITAAHCGLGCDNGCDAGCDAGCDVGCGGALLGLRSRLASSFQMNHCNSGCGEVYWDEQINERPTCDPCGCNNEFVGGASCDRCPGALHRLRQLWGFRYTPSNCSTCSTGNCGLSGCASCDSTGCSSCGSNNHTMENEVYSETTSSAPSMGHTNNASPSPVKSEPTPAKQPGPVMKEADGEPAVMITPRNQRPVSSGRNRSVPAKSASNRSR